MIYVVRHGQTDANINKIYQGWFDTVLNETGIQQARTLKEKIAAVHFDIVFASPLKRARQTAEIIHEGDIIFDRRLMERNNGELEGRRKTADVNFTDPNERRYGIEPLSDFRKRITDFWDEILTKYPNKNVLVVTHAGVGIYTQCYFKGEPQNGDYNSYKIMNCDILKFENKG